MDGSMSEIVVAGMSDSLPRLMPSETVRVIVISDANVHHRNLDFINSYDHIIIGQGESTKTLVTLEDVYRKLLALGADRDTFLLGMGGGVVTDITGFIASTYMRGMRFSFIPTTLLSQVDASIGGKNGVNLDGYKNIVGVFSQPEFVLCDPSLLKTLPEREFRSGLAEIIKAGIIGDPELFGLFEAHSFEELRSDNDLLRDVICRAINVKASIVMRDERERGERRKLNLGHTFAHAMEKSMPTFSHGEAVAAGMAIVCEAAVKAGMLPATEASRILKVIEKMGLPTTFPVELKKLLSAVRLDKKRVGDSIYIVLPTTVGNCIVEKIKLEDLEDFFL